MDFNKAALEWDTSEPRVRRAETVAGRIRELLGGNHRDRALEFGCGTGLLSFFLMDLFGTILMIDSSEGMLEVLRDKIRKADIKCMVPFQADLEHEEISIEPVNVIYSLMALHHVQDVEAVLAQFFSFLEPGGVLFIADLDSEDGSFHAQEPDFSGHNGFARDALEAQLRSAGFSKVTFETAFTTVKEAGGAQKEFPIFLLEAFR